MNKEKKIVFIASSGGHLTQLLQLKPLFKDYDSYLITEKDISTSVLTIDGAKVLYFTPTRKNKLIEYLWGNFKSLLSSIKYFFIIKPDVVISTGAGVCVYFCYLAKLFGKKIIFIETYAAIQGKSGAGKLIYPIADRFYVQWESMKKFYPKSIYKGTLY
ncbi:polysaccharide biosynthesis protein [Bacteroides caecigallinarum]|uniref:PssD/Cps14F family polysaccharide biosynthesis glycosyltransferase n=1 Tax=Bacteroides caecigallinarum TaxID=1411144 RepID=UPI001959A088|nr:PssD/Cps14F family polysaccharide biosynthesis glycosyltransferase [Bacteroides caecigallinarum]MBM6962070.1 polysaccharide biosynthesis protein [Bacteroides caecigallinarum]